MTSNSNPIQVLIVETSHSVARILTQIIHSDSKLKVMGCLSRGKEVIPFIKFHKPDVIVIDITLSDMDGFETTRQIMETQPIPIIIVSASFDSKDINKSFKAIQVGALEIIERPSNPSSSTFKILADALIQSIKNAAIIRLITRRHFSEQVTELQKQKEAENLLSSNMIKAVAIGASLGGPTALKTLFSQLSADFPIPILVVQHIAAGFNQGLVDWIQSDSPLKIKLAEEGERPQSSSVYIAPEHCHLEIECNQKIHLSKDPPEKGLRPSVGRLFRSVGRVYGKQAIGIILTGMGHDGAADLLLMKNSGSLTIAQDKESCLIFGMPKEAIALGAAELILSLEQIIVFLNSLRK